MYDSRTNILSRLPHRAPIEGFVHEVVGKQRVDVDDEHTEHEGQK